MKKLFKGVDTHIESINNPKSLDCHSCDTMDGLFDNMLTWADNTIDKVTGKAKEVADSITAKGTQFYNQAEALYNEGQENVDKKINEAREWIAKLKKKQSDVDLIIKNTKDPVEREILIAKREESRGIFNEYILPLVDKLLNEEEKIYAGQAYQDPTMMIAALPFVPIAIGASVIASASAVIYYSKQAYAIENDIINDSSLSSEEKARILSGLRSTGGLQSIGGAISAMKWPLIIGGLGFLALNINKLKKF